MITMRDSHGKHPEEKTKVRKRCKAVGASGDMLDKVLRS